jgi:HSP20 family protein
MALIRWQPFQEMETLRRQMDRMFDDLAGWNRDYQITWQPAIEVQVTDEAVVVRAEIPGVEGKDLDVRVTREAVAITGEHRYEQKIQEKGIFRSEFRYGKFQRVIPLPVPVQNDRVTADFTNGILTLTLPKVTSTLNRVVKLNLTESVASVEAAKEQLLKTETEVAQQQPVKTETVAFNDQPVNTETNDVWDSQAAEPAVV